MREVKQLLGLAPKGTLAYRNDNNHPLYPGTFTMHPDNRRALVAMSGGDYLAAQDNGHLEVSNDVEVSLGDNLALIGSPTSEGVSRLMMGYKAPATAEDQLLLESPPLDLPYRMVLDSRLVPEGAVAGRYVEGRGEVFRPNWYIESDRAMFIPDVVAGWLKTDLLLVTRVRNFLSSQGLGQDHFLVSFAGAHGVGTRGASLILRDKKVLSQIYAKTKGFDQKSFQALFAISSISHDPGVGSHGRAIELIDLQIISDDPSRWRTAEALAKPRVEEWLSKQRTQESGGEPSQ